MCTSGAKIKRPAVCHKCRGKYYCNTYYNILQLLFYVLLILFHFMLHFMYYREKLLTLMMH